MIRTRIRDFIVTDEDWIFAVADYTHSDGVRSILRYVPDPAGDRVKNGVRYRKLDFDDAYRFMREEKPEWLADVHVVPFDAVREVLNPVERIPELMKRDQRVAGIVKVLTKGGVTLEKMGVTGSYLPGLNNESSDIDFIVYGRSWFTARDVIAMAKKTDGMIHEIDDEMWHRIYDKRKPAISFEEFLSHEIRKGNRGMVKGTYFDLLYTRDWDKITPLQRGVDIERKQIEAVVINADYAFDTPAIYEVEHDEIKYVLSYTHTYVGQALIGERIEAKGMIEETDSARRLVVGTSREPRDEWIRSLTLLEEEKK
ncbi:DNA polymerase subunit beta [Methanosarcinales archaeon ex4572_44]|nr:MAG: DNA polymerase subunit beta [Methanosarcinales archaeon ex4572_44]